MEKAVDIARQLLITHTVLYAAIYYLFIFFNVPVSQSKGINQQLHGFSRLCFLETEAFQTAAEHSCWDCVTKHRNSFCIRSQLIVNDGD